MTEMGHEWKSDPTCQIRGPGARSWVLYHRTALALPTNLSNLCDDRQGYLLRSDGPKIEARWCTDRFKARRRDTVGDKFAAQCHHLPTATDKAEIGRFNGESGFQRRLVAPALRRNDNEPLSLVLRVDAKSIEEEIDLGNVRELIQRRGECDLISQRFRLLDERHGDRARAQNDEEWSRQDRLDEDVHRPLARTHVGLELHALTVLARLDAELVQQAFRPDRHQTRLAVPQRLTRRLKRCTARTATADPARLDATIGTNDGLGSGLGGGHRDRSNDGCQCEGPFRFPQVRNEIDHIDMGGHLRVLHSRAR